MVSRLLFEDDLEAHDRTNPNPSKSKTKCLFFSRSRSSDVISNVKLNGNKLPWVTKAKHLGNHLSSTLSHSPYCPETKTDLLCKRAILFDKVHQVQQQLSLNFSQSILQPCMVHHFGSFILRNTRN